MKPSQQTYLKFYNHLGKLFYAIAAADGNVRPQEIARLQELVREKWLGAEPAVDDYGTDAAYQIGVVFDWLVETGVDPRGCMHSFREFRDAHPTIFTRDIDRLVWKTADAIAAAFNGRNKKELIMLQELRETLMA